MDGFRTELATLVDDVDGSRGELTNGIAVDKLIDCWLRLFGSTEKAAKLVCGSGW